MKKRWIFLILGIILISIIWILSMHFITFKYILKLEDINNLNGNPNITISSDETLYTKDFGRYIVANNWIESQSHSTANKFFYIKDQKAENEEKPNNISINMGTNKYSSEEHEKFKTAILKQLSMQISNSNDLKINANGSYTEDNNYVVYEFDIYEEKENVTTKQFYIVGDYKYILVHETIYDQTDKDIDNVAKKMVDSFKWK